MPFETNNQMAIIYPKEQEKFMADYCKKLENDGNKHISEVLCFGNTIEENLKYDEMNPKLKDLGNDTNIDEYLIQNDVYQNEDLNKDISASLKNDITRLSNFTDKKKMTTKQTSSKIAEVLDIKTSDVSDLLIYYNSLNNTSKLKVKDFINFIDSFVLKSKYKENISKSNEENLNALKPFLDVNTLNTKRRRCSKFI